MSPPPLTIQLFGPLRVLVVGEPLPPVRTRSVEWLLALLVLRQGRAVDRSWLAGTLWPESEESKALHNLRNALVSLRKALGSEGERLQSPSRDTLTLDLTGAAVDLLAFDAAMQAGEETSLRSAVALYTGPLLEGCYEEWVRLERQSREQACLSALETLAQRAQDRGDHQEAIRHLRRAEALDPLRESIARHLMTSLAATNDPAAAIEVYRNLRERLHAQLAAAPDPETTLLFQQIRTTARDAVRSQRPAVPTTEAAPQTVPPLRASLALVPRPFTPLIGREKEVAEVQRLLGENRLVTLVGGGGVGKTRLAMEVVGLSNEDLFEEAFWMELASLSEGVLLLPTIAAALDIRQQEASEGHSLLRQVASRLSGHASLLTLDNCEHLLDTAAEVVQQLLSSCPGLHVLATSRQRLGIPGEVAWRVPSLSSPDLAHLPTDPKEASATALNFPAVRLFVERATSADSGFQLRQRGEVEAVCQICRRLDGIPLALELAAARVNVLSIEQIASRLDDRFRLLTGGNRATSSRQRTLRALIDWSYDLLSEPEQVLLRRLSVFAGGWSLEAAEYMGIEVFQYSGIEDEANVHNLDLNTDDVLDVLASLVDKSLVLAEEHLSGRRYRMLETVREYALEKLQESGEEEAVRERHADYYLTLAEQAHPFLATSQPVWLDRLEVEHDNLRAALTFFAAQEERIDKAVQLAAEVAPFWNLRGHYHEQRIWLVQLALRPTPPTVARARMLASAAHVVAHDKDYAGAKKMFTERLEIVRQLGDRQGIASALHGLAWLEVNSQVAGLECDSVAARAG